MQEGAVCAVSLWWSYRVDERLDARGTGATAPCKLKAVPLTHLVVGLKTWATATTWRASSLRASRSCWACSRGTSSTATNRSRCPPRSQHTLPHCTRQIQVPALLPAHPYTLQPPNPGTGPAPSTPSEHLPEASTTLIAEDASF